MTETLTYIDLFSGAGGFSLGFDKQGFKNIMSVDREANFCETYRHNFSEHRLVQKDICQLSAEEIRDYVEDKVIDVIIGGPPCQGFSMAGSIGRKFIDDPRNRLFKEFVRVVNIIKPRYFVMENVARLYTYKKGILRTEIIDDFKKLGYKVDCQVLNSADYGVPQMRQRVIFIGSTYNQDIQFPPKEVETYRTVKQALSHFPKLKSGQSSTIPNHVAMAHSEQMLKKMSYIADGGDRYDIPEAIRPQSGDIRKYIKYASDKPAVCVTGDMRKIFHYEQNRALTVRELARLQSFPDDFVFKGTRISQQQQVGNSVPPKMAEAIAKVIINMSEISKGHL